MRFCYCEEFKERQSNLKYTGGLLHFVRNDIPPRVIARSSNEEAIYRYTGGLLRFVRNDTPQRVIARSSNDEAIY